MFSIDMRVQLLLSGEISTSVEGLYIQMFVYQFMGEILVNGLISLVGHHFF